MAENRASNRLTWNVEGRDLVMERIFEAPRDLAFKVFSEPEHLANWWGPGGWQTEIHKFEFKPNGVWHYCMKCTDENQGEFYGQKSCGKAVYHEMIEPEKIVYTDTFVDEEGNAILGTPEIHVTIKFEEHNGKTKLITRSQFSSAEILQQIMDMGVVQGCASQYECLDDYLIEIQ